MKLTLTIQSDDDAAQEREEVARVLRKAAGQLEDGDDERAILDVNGNRIGKWRLSGVR